VAPLAGDRVRPDPEHAVDDEAAADAGAEDRAEDDATAGAGAVARLGEGEAVGVVGDAHLAPSAAQVATRRRPLSWSSSRS
jgi:hypothetical protein